MVRRLFKILLWISVTASLTLSLAATDYYVDFERGSDQNSGLGKNKAFKRCPGDQEATATAAATVLKPGDVVYFKGGVTYVGRVDIQWDGQADGYITYDSGDNIRWGKGHALFDLDHRYYHAFFGYARNYIRIRGFDFTRAKNGRDNPDHHGIIKARTASSHWIIEDCIFRDLQDWDVMCPIGANTSMVPAHNAIDVRGADASRRATDFLIRNCEFWRVGRTAVSILWSDDVRIEGNDFGGRDRTDPGFFSVALRIGGPNRKVRIVDNVFHDGWQYEGDDPGSRCHAGDWIHIHGNHDGRSTDDKDPHDIEIERNLFYNNMRFRHAAGTAMSFMEDDAYDIEWRNNVLINPHRVALLVEARDVRLYNNTIVGYEPTVQGGQLPIQIAAGSDDVIMQNNILVSFSKNSAVMPLILSSADDIARSDNNVLFKKHARDGQVVRVGSSNYTLKQWTGLFNFDGASSDRDPRLTSVPTSGGDSLSGDFRLSADSENAINQGFRLFTFENDHDGRQRDQLWDIGAFEYFSGKRPKKVSGVTAEKKTAGGSN